VTQFIAVSLAAGKRTYTYHNDGEPVQIGDKVKLPAPRGEDGWIPGIVEAVVSAPSFGTKPVIGIIETDADRAHRKGGAA